MARGKVRTRIDAGPLKAIKGGVRGHMRDLVEEQAQRTKDYIREEAPVGQGAEGHTHMRDTIYVRAAPGSGRTSFIVGTSSLVAVFVVKGTRPHIIVPRRATALRFSINGQVVFSKFVTHPGTAPNDFFGRGATRAKNEFIPKMLPALQHYIKGKAR
jgi:hypothetical protein